MNPTIPGLNRDTRSTDARPPPRVVIVGAGFGGLEAARGLRSAPVDVLLVDRNNFHTFQPLLYQVATAGIEPGSIAHTTRGIFQGQRNVSFRLGEVIGIDTESRTVTLATGPAVPYDFLVVAAGSSTHWFGVPGAAERAFPLKSLADAVNLRSQILTCFERAAHEPETIGSGVLDFVIAGGGPTGVETAGALAELIDRVLVRDFRELDPTRARVILVEAAPHLLGPFHERLRAYALRVLRRRGVEVLLGDPVHRVDDDGVWLASGRLLRTRTLVWAAGVRAASLADALGAGQGPGGRVSVSADLSLEGHPEVFVIGDMAGPAGEDGRPYPLLATVAVQEGRHTARQIVRRVRGLDSVPFRYRDPGIMATIGRSAAVVELPRGIRLTGYVAWVAWLALHIWKLIGFRNRFSVMLDWVHNYFTYDRSARLIFEARQPMSPGGS
jgi:NADH dehydrogenase